MTSVNVLVIFYSRHGGTEKLALAAGVGAIQARANIRLRRLTDFAETEEIQRDPVWAENLERMKQDYIAPRDVDAQWADALILAAPQGNTAEMERYLSAATVFLTGKFAAVIGPFGNAAASAGVVIVPPKADAANSERATAYGREMVEEARVRKDTHPAS